MWVCINTGSHENLFFVAPYCGLHSFLLYVDDAALLVACTRGNNTVECFEIVKIPHYNKITVASSALNQQWDEGLYLPRDRHRSGSSYFH